MASQPLAGTGLQPAPPAGPDRGSGPPPEPTSTPRAKRRRDTEAQALRPSLVGSQPDTPETTPLTAKGPSNTNGAATGSILAALDEQARLYEARKDALKRLMNNGAAPAPASAPTPARSWATIAASGPTTAASALAPTSTTVPAQNRALARSQPRVQPEDLRVFVRIPEEGLEAARKNALFALRRTICQALNL
ncbi:hypothetical protein CSOJ01_15689 [Colletotrichum sojae]|uniref:Uncharacterized protein n=1 Tax=Colletotrichum sojae TaxID=2175907 RepID=A0A8H6ILV2_9PEZI|nr:hypothetical protein CSOJ01_15689 [Colletotrichum sojae]